MLMQPPSFLMPQAGAGFAQAAWGQGMFAPGLVQQPRLATAPAPGCMDITSSIVAALQGHMPSTAPAPVEQALTGGGNLGASDGLQSLLMNSLQNLDTSALGGSSETQELLRVVQRVKAEPGMRVKAEPSFVKAEPDAMAPVPAPALPAPTAQSLPPPAADATLPQAVKAEASGRSARRRKAAVKIETVDLEEVGGSPPLPVKREVRAKREAHVGDQAPTRSKLEDDDESDDGMPHRLPPGFGAIPEDIVEERQRQREEERMLQLKATQPCRFGKRCKKRDCPNAHVEGRDIDSEINPCAFGRRCKRQGCFYDHPEGRMIDDDPTKGMCKFGVQCARADCLYSHPEGRVAIAGLEPKVCFFCHGDGHIATECPRNPESWCYDRQAAMRAAAQGGEIKALTN
eukprot:TRINITY_DN16998_c0_g1_i2.p1 TRINITY_DN16998_c0_g1~~TRINITY_DN16998_c0_g1_i2.p1  ORF type:complete len:471 (-),score=101.04 TRINITY_DN16998_c0_g1_i2:65-1267(-)